MDDRTRRIIADECDRLQAELQATSQRSLFPDIQSSFSLLKSTIWHSSPALATVTQPFESIVLNEQATDVITCLALSSIQSFLSNSIFRHPSDADRLCDCLIGCSFQSTSDYDCGCVSQKLMTAIELLCGTGLVSSRSMRKLFEYLVRENSLDTFSAVVRAIFRSSEIDIQVWAVARLCGLKGLVRGFGLSFLLDLSRRDLSPKVFEAILIAASVLLHEYLTIGIDVRDNFVIVLRLFFNVFSVGYTRHLLPFAKCFELFLSYINDSNVPAPFHVICLGVLRDFIAQDDFVANLFLNFRRRLALPDLASQLTQTLLAETSLFSLDVSLQFFERIPTFSQVPDFDQENLLFAELNEFTRRFNANPSGSAEGEKVSVLAERLFMCPIVSRQSVGTLFGRSDQVSTLNAFLRLFDFTSFDFDESIRLFLASFQIAGEGQIVDRIFECFARVYFEGHPNEGLASVAAAHVLAYGWLMMHTSFHNNNVNKKPAFENFEKLLAAQNGGGDFNSDLLHRLFASVRDEMVPFDDAKQLHTAAFWRLLVQRERRLRMKVVRGASEGNYRAIELFCSFWDAHRDRLFVAAESEEAYRVPFVSCLRLAGEYGLTRVVDAAVAHFAKVAVRDLTENVGTKLLGFVSNLVTDFADALRMGWAPFVEILVTLFHLELAPDELIECFDVETGGVTRLTNRMTSAKRFRFFRGKSDGEFDRSLQNEVREQVARTSCHLLPQLAKRLAAQSLAALVQGIVELPVEANSSSFCLLLLTKILCEVRQFPTLCPAFFAKVFGHNAKVVLNCAFRVATEIFADCETVVGLFDAICQTDFSLLQPHYSIVEKGLLRFFDKHLAGFASLHKWKSVVKLLAFGISNKSLVCNDLFEDLVGQQSGKLDFDECWVPVLQVYIGIGNAKNVQLQSWLLSAEWSSNQWREVFNGLLFPALTCRIGDLAMLKTVLKTFLYALNALMESPLFQTIWFRILSGMLEAGRAQKYHEELAEMLANAVRVMRENGAFDTRQRMWELTKSNIETSFPEVIRPLVED